MAFIKNIPHNPSLLNTGRYKIQRGYMQSPHDAGLPNGNRYRLDFVFNPATINISMQPMVSLEMPNYQNSLQSRIGDIRFPAAKVLTFDLMFDRTYDMAHPFLKNEGVMHDVGFLEAMVGISPGQPLPLPTPINFYFGGDNKANPLRFTGWIDQLQVSYTHFSQTMVPMRCGVSITSIELSNVGNLADLKESVNGGSQTGLGEEKAVQDEKAAARERAKPPSRRTGATRESTPGGRGGV